MFKNVNIYILLSLHFYLTMMVFKYKNVLAQKAKPHVGRPQEVNLHHTFPGPFVVFNPCLDSLCQKTWKR